MRSLVTTLALFLQLVEELEHCGDLAGNFCHVAVPFQFMFSFQVRWLVALFLPSLSVSGLPRAVQVRPTLSPVSGVPGPEHAQTGSGAIGLGRALALPAP